MHSGSTGTFHLSYFMFALTFHPVQDGCEQRKASRTPPKEVGEGEGVRQARRTDGRGILWTGENTGKDQGSSEIEKCSCPRRRPVNGHGHRLNVTALPRTLPFYPFPHAWRGTTKHVHIQFHGFIALLMCTVQVCLRLQMLLQLSQMLSSSNPEFVKVHQYSSAPSASPLLVLRLVLRTDIRVQCIVQT